MQVSEHATWPNAATTPDYLATLKQIWRGQAAVEPAPATVQGEPRATAQATADERAADLVALIGKLTDADATTPDAAAAAVAAAHACGEPAWAAAARGVLACYLMQAGEEPSAIAQLVLAELEVTDARERTTDAAEAGIVPSGEAAACNNLGVAHSQLGFYELAGPHLARAAAISAATYRGEFATQALVDVYNLAEFEVRRALQLAGLDRDDEAIEAAEAALTRCEQVHRLATQHAGWESLARVAECLAIAARSIIDLDGVTEGEEAIVDALAQSDSLWGPDTEGLVLTTQARLRRLLGDAQGARASAGEVVRRASESDLAIICVAWREASLVEGSADTATARYAALTAAAMEAMRQRAVRDFQSRVDMARLERQHARAIETTARLQEALDSAAMEEARLLHAATHDSLTQLPNRALLTERLQSTFEHARTEAHYMTVAFVDVNGLKAVNDLHGHAAGDRFVCDVADLLRSVTMPRDTVARVGGDEFVVVLARPSERQCRDWIELLAEALRRDPYEVTVEHPSRASAGVCVIGPTCQLTGAEILARADLLMYEAKSARSAQPAVEVIG